MDDPLDALTDKEKETLRLIVRGHDAKSSARELDLSVHTINERLRAARRKLDVTSSREAARLLLESEETASEKVVYETFGDASKEGAPHNPANDKRDRYPAFWIGGIAMILVSAAALAMALSTATTPTNDEPESMSAHIAASDAIKEGVAGEWLALVDAGEWDDAYAASSSRFRASLDLAAFRSTTAAVRDPMGEVAGRKAIGFSDVSQNGNDYAIVRFRTEFENGGVMTEQVTLETDDGELRVTGYFFV